MYKSEPGVYMILNVMNDWRYVGSAARSISRRWSEHRYALKNNKHRNQHLQNAWNKYGSSAFVFIVLENCEPELVLTKEQSWFDLFKSQSMLMYNKRENVASQLGLKHSDETKCKISEISKKQMNNPEFKAIKSELLKKLESSQSSINKRKLSIKRKWNSIEYRIKRNLPISIQFISPDGFLYSNIVNLSDFCSKESLDVSAMWHVWKGELSHYKGWRKYIWQELTIFTETIRADNVPHTIISPDGVVYNDVRNLKRFCNENGLNYSGLRSVVIGECHQYKGWQGFRQGIEQKPKYIRTTRDWPEFVSPNGETHCIQNLFQFCKEHGLDKAAMQRVANGKSKSHKGWRLA